MGGSSLLPGRNVESQAAPGHVSTPAPHSKPEYGGIVFVTRPKRGITSSSRPYKRQAPHSKPEYGGLALIFWELTACDSTLSPYYHTRNTLKSHKSPIFEVIKALKTLSLNITKKRLLLVVDVGLHPLIDLNESFMLALILL